MFERSIPGGSGSAGCGRVPDGKERGMPTVAFDVIGTLGGLERATRRLAELGAPEHSLDLGVAAFRVLDTRPEAGEACGMFSEAGSPILALTNGAEETTRALLERGGLLA